MPTYIYHCTKCDHELEEFQSFSENPLVKCPKCHKDTLQRGVGGGAGFTVRGGTSSMGGSYVSQDSAEQKFQERLANLE